MPKGRSLTILDPTVLVGEPQSRVQKAFYHEHGIDRVSNIILRELKSLYRTIQKAPQPVKHVRLFRGISIKSYQDLNVGQEFNHPFIMSTSTFLSEALSFVEGDPCCIIMLDVDVTKVPVLMVYNAFVQVTPMNNEFEVLLPPVVMKLLSKDTVRIKDMIDPIEKRIFPALMNRIPDDHTLTLIHVTCRLPKRTLFRNDCIEMQS